MNKPKPSNYSFALIMPILISFVMVSGNNYTPSNPIDWLNYEMEKGKQAKTENIQDLDNQKDIFDTAFNWFCTGYDSLEVWMKEKNYKHYDWEDIWDEFDYSNPILNRISALKENNHLFDSSNIYLTEDGTTLIKLSEYPDKDAFFDYRLNYYFLDLNNDGKMELVVVFWGGGGHCCNYLNIFKEAEGNVYVKIFENFRNQTLIDFYKDGCITTDVTEHYSYFSACYACNLNTLMPYPEVLGIVSLKYDGNKMYFHYNADSVNIKLEANMKRMQEVADRFKEHIVYKNLDALGFYTTLLHNVLSYHFNNHQDFKKTKKFLFKYYTLKDKEEVADALFDAFRDDFPCEFTHDIKYKPRNKK